MNEMRVYVDGIGLWSPELANFAALGTQLIGETPEPPPQKPAASMLPPNERRRAPESVLLAVEVAGQAVHMSTRSADSLACIFASAHGDQAITDYMCTTLANAPTELSPMRFHQSVHNAPVGYWTMVTGCHAPSSAIAAQRASFGAGLLEAATQALAEQHAVLLVCSDIAGVGALLETTGCISPFGCALVLAPTQGAASVAQLSLTLIRKSLVLAEAKPASQENSPNASALALPLLVSLAQKGGSCTLDVSDGSSIQINTEILV